MRIHIASAITLLIATACSPSAASRELITLSDGTTIEFAPDLEVRREDFEGRVALRSEDGIVITIQEVESADRLTGGRTPRAVAAAIAERIELGEREGELAHHSCQAGTRDTGLLPAECTEGWMITADGERFARRGFVIEAGTRITWIDVAGPEERVEQINERLRAVRESLTVGARR